MSENIIFNFISLYVKYNSQFLSNKLGWEPGTQVAWKLSFSYKSQPI